MRTSRRSLAWHEDRLQSLLPGPAESALLRACLGAPPLADAAWQEFVALTGDPKRFFETSSGGLKGLLPFVDHCLQQRGLAAKAEFHTYTRVAVVREDLRFQLYRDIFSEVARELYQRRIHPVVLRGLPLAMLVYPDPARRHNHGIELLIGDSELARGGAALLALGCRPASAQAPASRHHVFVHPSGLTVTLHSRSFELPHFLEPLDCTRARAIEVDVCGVSVKVPSAADHLIHLCGHAVYSTSRRNLRWICDAAQLIRSQAAFPWDHVIPTAERAGLALPLAVMLTYLREVLQVPLPHTVVVQLRGRHRLSCYQVREGIYAGTTPPRGGSVRADARSLLSLLRFRLLPSRDYLRWRYGVSGAREIAACYGWRPVRFVLRRVSRALPETIRRGTGLALSQATAR